jgi:hypothetical protein
MNFVLGKVFKTLLFQAMIHPLCPLLSKKAFRSLAVVCGLGVLLFPALPRARSAEEVKLLTVGNSFADNSTSYLEKFAEAAGKKLRLYKANRGAHSMKMHVGYINAYEANPQDPKGSPYEEKGQPKLSLRKALELEKWDYVTIQQLSAESFYYSSYEPAAGVLVEYIRKYAPQAKILGLQTWAYREDSYIHQKLGGPGKMHMGIRDAYRQLGEKYGIGVLPVGEAFYMARATPRWTFQYPDPNFDKATAKPPALPEQPGSLSVGWKWDKDAKGEPKLENDFAHCNSAGQFLATAVLYESLFGGVETNTYCPPKMTEEDAASLRRIARDTVAQFPITPRSPAENKMEVPAAATHAEPASLPVQEATPSQDTVLSPVAPLAPAPR